MRALRSHLALLLLLCLTRTLLPEAWVLALHPHAHTTEEPAQAAVFVEKGKALLSTKHQHCAVEQFYDVAYQAGAPVLVPVPAGRLAFAGLAVPAVLGQPGAARREPVGRGPPAA
jgi:predicted RecB family nuclease